MKYELVIKPLAELDILSVFNWYEDQSLGLGRKFLDAIDIKIDQILKNPLGYQTRYKNVRWALINRFPYAIHFMLEAHKIIVIAVLSTSRNPKSWER